jgi:hypothetical protein
LRSRNLAYGKQENDSGDSEYGQIKTWVMHLKEPQNNLNTYAIHAHGMGLLEHYMVMSGATDELNTIDCITGS